jgi:hypothetical protein
MATTTLPSLDNSKDYCLLNKRTTHDVLEEVSIVSSLLAGNVHDHDDSSDSSTSSCSSSTSFAEEDEDDNALVGITRSPWETAGEEYGNVNPDFFFYRSPPNKDACVVPSKPSLEEEESDVSTTLDDDDDSEDVYDDDDSDGEDPWAAALPLLKDDEGKVVEAKTRVPAPFFSSISPWKGLAPIEEEEEAESDEEEDDCSDDTDRTGSSSPTCCSVSSTDGCNNTTTPSPPWDDSATRTPVNIWDHCIRALLLHTAQQPLQDQDLSPVTLLLH